MISERGSAYTWFENAHEFRLTPGTMTLSPILEGRLFTCATKKPAIAGHPCLPVQGNTAYVTKHGFGYSVFEHSETGIVSDALIFTDTEQPIKFVIINIHNTSGRGVKSPLPGIANGCLVIFDRNQPCMW